MKTDPINAAPMAAAVVTCPSRSVPTWAELYRPGESTPFAVVPVAAFFLIPPDAGRKDDAGKEVSPPRGAELRLRMYVPRDQPTPPAGVVPPGVPVKVAGALTESVPNAADGPA